MSAGAPGVERGPRAWWLPDPGEAGVLLLIAVLGAISLPTPFWGDQALFVVFARELDEGATLYVDAWDTKQPGIFYFYLLAGRLFGFHEIGVHALELAWQLAFALVLLRTGCRWLAHRAASLALPLLTLGSLYLIAKYRLLGQVEALVGFPLYLVLWFSLGPLDAPRRRATAFATGLCGGAIVWLKLYFGPIVAVLWALALARHLRETRGDLRAVARRFVLPLAVGFALPVLALAAWAWATGAISELWWTYFVFPTIATDVGEPLPGQLGRALLFCARGFAPGIAFAVLGLGLAIAGRRRDAVLAGAVAWLVVGVVLVAGQVFWWEYYLLLVLVPVGMLGAMGLDGLLASRIRGRAIVALLIVGLALIPGVQRFGEKARLLWRHDLAVNRWSRLLFQAELHPRYAASVVEAEFIEKAEVLKPEDAVYVFGDPAILFLLGRTYPIPINGWSYEEWPEGVWERVVADLRRTRPTVIYTAALARRPLARMYPPLVDFLSEEYELLRSSTSGSWFLRKSPAPPPPSAP